MSDEAGRYQPARARGPTVLLADAIPLLCLLPDDILLVSIHPISEDQHQNLKPQSNRGAELRPTHSHRVRRRGSSCVSPSHGNCVCFSWADFSHSTGCLGAQAEPPGLERAHGPRLYPSYGPSTSAATLRTTGSSTSARSSGGSTRRTAGGSSQSSHAHLIKERTGKGCVWLDTNGTICDYL